MKRVFQFLGGALLVLIAVAAAFVAWLALRKPASRPPSAEHIEATPQRVARGEYLTRHVADCFSCHSDHLLTFGIPVKPGTDGQGGFVFDEKLGIPGTVCAQNITPDPETGIGKWTDGEVLRAIREGIDRNGNALFPMMPYPAFHEMSDEDAKSVVVYLRTLPAIRHSVPVKRINFPVNLLVKFAPRPVETSVAGPDPSNTIAYGQYLTTIGGCRECHTPHNDKNEPIAEKAFSGGWEMRGPWGRNVTANLTPHPDTFVGRATKAEFIARFRAFQNMDHTNAPACPKGRNTVMPWLGLSHMTDDDLGAVYDYLKTQKPIANRVNTFPDAS